MIVSPIIKPTIEDFYVPDFCRGLWMFDNPSNKIIDLSQYGNHGTNSGSTFKGNWNTFNGSSDYVSLPNNPSVDITTAPLAIFTTIKVASGAGTGFIISKNLDAVANIQYAMYWYATNNRIGYVMEGAEITNSGTNTILTNNWYDVGFIWKDGIFKTFANYKKRDVEVAYSATLTSRSNLTIGRRETASVYFNGNISNIAIYSSADIGEILRHRRMLSQQFGIAA